MFPHPKYTIVYDESRYQFKYVIMEHVTNYENAVMSKEYNAFLTMEDAMKVMGYLSTGPILLASSAQCIDNTFDVGNG